MDYLLDTNIIIIYSRNSDISRRIELDSQLFDSKNSLAISVVTLGELDALIRKLGIGEERKQRIYDMLQQVAKIRMDVEEVITRYGEIDAYSQGALKNKKGKFTARNMGKNDIWIAATASVYDLTLVTTDKDFDHLDGEYIKLKYVDRDSYKIRK